MAIEVQPDEAEHYVNRAVAYARQGNEEKALADESKAIEVNPKYALAYMNRGQRYRRMKQHDAAIRDFTSAIENDPDSSMAFQVRGLSFAATGDHDKAIADFDKAISLIKNPRAGWLKASFYIERGKSNTAKKDFNAAFSDFATAIRLDPSQAYAYKARADAYAAIGDTGRASGDYACANRIKAGAKRCYGMFGATTKRITRNRKERSNGVLIIAIIPGGPAAEAGLKVGDIILSVNGIAIVSHEHFANLVRLNSPQTKIDTVIRHENGREETVVVTLSDGDWAQCVTEAWQASSGAANVCTRIIEEQKPGGARLASALYHRGVARFQTTYASWLLSTPELPENKDKNQDEVEQLHRRLFAKSESDLSEAIRLKSDYAEAYRFRGYMNWALRKLDRALADLDNAIRLDPHLRRAYLDRAMVYLGKGNVEKQLSDLTAAIQVDPEDFESYEIYDRRASVYLTTRRYNKAVADYSAMIRLAERRDENPPPSFSIEGAGTVTATVKLREPSSKVRQGYDKRGLAYLANDNHEKAEADFAKAVEQWRGGKAALLRLGNEHEKQGHHRLAVAYFDKAIALDPEYPSAIKARAVSRYKLKDYRGAIADYTQLIEIAPTVSGGYLGRAQSYAMKGDARRAEADFAKAMELNPKDADPYWFRGSWYGRKAQYEKAITDMSKTIELAPKFPEGYNSRAWFRFKIGEYEKGLPDVEKALQLKEHAYYFDTRGHLFEALGRKEEAIADYRKAIELAPEDRNLKETREALERLETGR